MDPEIRIVRIAEALGRYGSGALSCLEAAEVLGMSERHFRRLRDRYEAEGAAGLVDRRLGLTRDGRYAKPGYPQASSQRNGHLMCYKNRTSLCVIDRTGLMQWLP